MKWMPRLCLGLAIVVWLMAGLLGCSPRATPQPLGPRAVWQLPDGALDTCLATAPDGSQCLRQAMIQHGATPQALLANQFLEGDGYLKDYRDMGRVALATAVFPLRANTNEAVVLVGGQPGLVSSELPANAVDITTAAGYPALRRRYPQAELWPTSAVFQGMTHRTDGGQSFLFAYPIRNGCHACEVAGQAEIALDFATDGTFLGPRLVRLQER